MIRITNITRLIALLRLDGDIFFHIISLGDGASKAYGSVEF